MGIEPLAWRNSWLTILFKYRTNDIQHQIYGDNFMSPIIESIEKIQIEEERHYIIVPL